jgi:cytochrome P450
VQHLLIQPDHVKYVLSDNKDNYIKGIGYRKLQLALGSGLFTSEGELWRRQRRIMQPTFTPRGVLQFADVMTDASKRIADRWEARAAKEGKSAALDVNREMMRLAMSIIARTMLSIDIRLRSGGPRTASR